MSSGKEQIPPIVVNLKRQVNSLEGDVQRLSQMLGALVGEDGGRTGGVIARNMTDVPWQCTSCSYMLGWYDPDKEELRIRKGDHYVWIRLGGPDAYTKTICRHCGCENQLDWEPAAEHEQDEPLSALG